MGNLTEPVAVVEPVDHSDKIVAAQQLNEADIRTEVEAFLGIDAGIPSDVRERLGTIIDVVSNEAESNADVIEKLSALQKKIGAAYTGSEAINRMFTYAKLMKNRIELDKMIKAYEVNDGAK